MKHGLTNLKSEQFNLRKYQRIALGTKAYSANLKFFKSRLVTKQSKLKLYRIVIRPIVTYASEYGCCKKP
jgi:hypothetical protein